MHRYSLDRSSKKFHCPSCGKKRFTLFVDNETGAYLDKTYGRCDREVNCKYFNKPENAPNFYSLPRRVRIAAEKPPSFIARELVQKSMSGYNRNPLYTFLIERFEESQVHHTFQKYGVGTSEHWDGATVFWQLDDKGRARTGKIIKYKNGKRVRSPKSLIHWAHKLLRLEDFNLKQVPFGTHLLSKYKGTTICIVESEKTALIMDLFCPHYLWIGLGSINMLKIENIKLFHEYNLVLYPDSDAHNNWVAKAKSLERQLRRGLHVSELVIQSKYADNSVEGYDIADIVLSNPDLLGRNSS